MSDEKRCAVDEDDNRATITSIVDTTTEDQKWQWLLQWRRQECHRLQVPPILTPTVISTLRDASLPSEDREQALRTIRQGIRQLQQQNQQQQAAAIGGTTEQNEKKKKTNETPVISDVNNVKEGTLNDQLAQDTEKASKDKYNTDVSSVRKAPSRSPSLVSHRKVASADPSLFPGKESGSGWVSQRATTTTKTTTKPATNSIDSEWEFLRNEQGYVPHPSLTPFLRRRLTGNQTCYVYQCVFCYKCNIQANHLKNHAYKCPTHAPIVQRAENMIVVSSPTRGDSFWECGVCRCKVQSTVTFHVDSFPHQQRLKDLQKNDGMMLVGQQKRQHGKMRFECRFACRFCQVKGLDGYDADRHVASESHVKNKKPARISDTTCQPILEDEPYGKRCIEKSAGLNSGMSSSTGRRLPINPPRHDEGRQATSDLQNTQSAHTSRSHRGGKLQWMPPNQHDHPSSNDRVNSPHTASNGYYAASRATETTRRERSGYILSSDGGPPSSSPISSRAKRKSCSDIDATPQQKTQRTALRSASIPPRFQAKSVPSSLLHRSSKPSVRILPASPATSYPLTMQLREDSTTPGTFSGLLETRRETIVQFVAEKVEPIDLVHRIERFDPFWKVTEILSVSITSLVTNTVPPAKASVKSALQQSVCISDKALFRIPSSKWGTNRKFDHGDSAILLRMYPVKPLKNLPDCHRWPKGTFLQINGKPVAIQQSTQQAHNLNEWCGMSKPLHLSNHLSAPTKEFLLQLGAADDRRFILAVTLCTYQSPNKLLKNLCNNGDSVGFRQLSVPVGLSKAIDFASKSLAVIVDQDGTVGGSKLSSNDEGKFIVSLTCPISMQRMESPVRGRNCKHFQCFDLFNYLSTNSFESGNRWRCASCERFLSVGDLDLCGLTKSLLVEFSGQLDRDRVQVHADGTYCLLPAKQTRQQSTAPCLSGAPEVVIL